MRVLFGCSMGGSGHLIPVLDVADAFIRQGHECVLLVPPGISEAASRGGMRLVIGAQPAKPFVDELWERVRRGPPERVVGVFDQELFAGAATDMMREPARALCAEFGPDLIVREPCEYATSMAAHEAGVPQIQIGISLAQIEAAVLQSVATSLERRCPGVVNAIRSAPYLTVFPALTDLSPWQDTRRYRVTPSEVDPLPDWWPTMRERPLVYVTFGSVLGGTHEALDVYRTALEATADLPVKVLMTVGRQFDPQALRPFPANTRIEHWVPQAQVLPHADAVVCQGGSGTTNGALAAGLPIVVCPLFADQSANARSVERIGAGILVQSHERPAGGVASLGRQDATAIAAAVVACLHEPKYRQAATRVSTELARTPTLDDLIRSLTT